MTSPTAVNIFDGHNDLAYQLWQRGDHKGTAFLNKMRRLKYNSTESSCRRSAGRAVCSFCSAATQRPDTSSAPQQAYAFETACQMAAILNQLSDDHPGRFQVCRSASEIDAATDAGALAAVLHLEGQSLSALLLPS